MPTNFDEYGLPVNLDPKPKFEEVIPWDIFGKAVDELYPKLNEIDREAWQNNESQIFDEIFNNEESLNKWTVIDSLYSKYMD